MNKLDLYFRRPQFEEWVMKRPKPGTHLTRGRDNDSYLDNRVNAKWASWKEAIRCERAEQRGQGEEVK